MWRNALSSLRKKLASRTSSATAVRVDDGSPRGVCAIDGWRSWDSQPWRHPWLTAENLSSMREYSRQMRLTARHLVEEVEAGKHKWSEVPAHKAQPTSLRFAFVGNIANNMYVRAQALKCAGIDVDIYGHPQDKFIMSYPEWEQFDDDVPDPISSIDELRRRYLTKPVPKFHVVPEVALSAGTRLPQWVRKTDYSAWQPYFSQLPTLQALRAYDCLIAVQAPYLAYLSGRPYYACHFGGDLWYECSRDDSLGSIQRRSFEHAAAILVSNPWIYAFSRRHGFVNALNLPLMLDEDRYVPGEQECRAEWEASSGGSFFVLQTARMDNYYKQSAIAIEGFARFVRQHPRARLVILCWGKDEHDNRQFAEKLGVSDKCIYLPICGKRRLIRYLQSADCLLDQFRLGYYGATAVEALACGLPVVMRIEKAQYDAHCETDAPPVLNAENPEQVASQLARLYSNETFRRSTGAASRAWFLANHGSRRWAPEYRNFLIALALGHRFDFDRSPLMQPLTEAEARYHADELGKAPPFPNYV